MSSTFFGLTIAGSGLNAYQVALNTTANNVSNVNTNGYTRQEAVRVAAEALRTNQRYGMAGSGVMVTEISQTRDFYYDVKYWENNAKVGYYDTELYYMQQIEDYLIDDDTAKGFKTILDEMFNSLETLHNTPESLDARAQFVSKSQSFANFFTAMNVGFVKIQEDCNAEIATQVENINSIGQKIALLNRQINIIEIQGTNANELRDQRALLVDELSELVSVEVTETKVTNANNPDMYTGATNYLVKINGQTLVDTFDYKTLTCEARESKVNQSDAEGLYEVYWTGTNNPLNVTGNDCDGRLKGLFEMRDGNNNEGFTGTVKSITGGASGDVVTIMNPSITDVNSMTMEPEGVITINNTEYKYKGFSYDAETNTYEFQLVKPLSVDQRNTLQGRSAAIGSNIDAMGIPYYQAQANNFLREFAKQLNEIHKQGVDANGDAGISFFVAVNAADGSEYDFSDYNANGSMSTEDDSYYLLTTSNIQVATDIQRSPTKVVTETAEDQVNGVANQSLIEQMLTLKSEVKMFRGGGADEFLECLISDNSVDTQKVQIFLNNYTNISETIVQKRMSISAVDEDEEALDMIKFQNAYNLASRMIQTMTELYDRLILETGV